LNQVCFQLVPPAFVAWIGKSSESLTRPRKSENRRHVQLFYHTNANFFGQRCEGRFLAIRIVCGHESKERNEYFREETTCMLEYGRCVICRWSEKQIHASQKGRDRGFVVFMFLELPLISLQSLPSDHFDSASCRVLM
jgi:hypothetical protein